MTLAAPFPYFGGKRKVAREVWRRFGDTANYVEPFAGSAAMLLSRPSSHQGHIETINDKDGYVANFWRAIAADPQTVAAHADWPVNENDLHARHAWLVGRRDALSAALEGDPEYYDAKIAGWWVWGMCAWIGSGFCSGTGPWQVVDGKLCNVNDGDAGQGVNRKLVHLGDAGRGVNRQLVHLSNAGQGVNRQREGIYEWFEALSARLRDVRVCSGDWTRVCGDAPTWRHGLTGVFLDPPYDQEGRAEVYNHEDPVSQAVREWAIEAGKSPLMRIALCGYEGEHEMPEGWSTYAWKAHGGYGSQDKSGGEGRGLANAHRERIWFSPACIGAQTQGALL